MNTNHVFDVPSFAVHADGNVILLFVFFLYVQYVFEVRSTSSFCLFCVFLYPSRSSTLGREEKMKRSFNMRNHQMKDRKRYTTDKEQNL